VEDEIFSGFLAHSGNKAMSLKVLNNIVLILMAL